MTVMVNRTKVRTASASDTPAPVAFEAESLQQEIAQLRDLDLDGVRLRWRNLFGRAAPTHLPKFLLLRIIAYRMQANVYGDLSKNARRTLNRLARGRVGEDRSETTTRLRQADPQSLRAGTQFVREWGGVMYRVTVVDDGFLWDGATYPSLSKVALAITGTRWNGPRFFGMRAKRSQSDLKPTICDRAEAERRP